MALTYNPTEANKNLWPVGDYDAALMSVAEGTSGKTGQPMETWQIGCYHPDGREQTIKEYVTASAAFKIKQLATALNRKAEFEAGTFQAENHIGANFSVALIIEESDGYDDKNKVGRFKPRAVKSSLPASRPVQSRAPATIGAGVREKMAAKPAAQQPFGNEQEFKEDDIPF